MAVSSVPKFGQWGSHSGPRKLRRSGGGETWQYAAYFLYAACLPTGCMRLTWGVLYQAVCGLLGVFSTWLYAACLPTERARSGVLCQAPPQRCRRSQPAPDPPWGRGDATRSHGAASGLVGRCRHPWSIPGSGTGRWAGRAGAWALLPQRQLWLLGRALSCLPDPCLNLHL